MKGDGLLWDGKFDPDELSRWQQKQACLQREFARHYLCNPWRDDMGRKAVDSNKEERKWVKR